MVGQRALNLQKQIKVTARLKLFSTGCMMEAKRFLFGKL